MKKVLCLHAICLITLLWVSDGCKGNHPTTNGSVIAVTNSYLHCAVEDLSAGQADILCLAPPGMCPGHFDISPEQLNKLRNARILLRFDFQKGLDERLSRLRRDGLFIGSVRALPGLCAPETYLAVCRDIYEIFCEHYPENKTKYKQRLAVITTRMEALGHRLHSQVKRLGLERVPVVASTHQAEFAGWLRLEVVATFTGADTSTPSAINDCLSKAKGRAVKFIIANRQEGTALAEALAEHLDAKVVVMSNFPQVTPGQDNFDRLLQQNLEAFSIKAAQ